MEVTVNGTFDLWMKAFDLWMGLSVVGVHHVRGVEAISISLTFT